MGIENDTAIARQLFATFHIRYIIVEIVHDMIFLSPYFYCSTH